MCVNTSYVLMNQIENVIILKLGKSSSIPSCNTRLTASWIEKRYSHIFVCSVDIFEDASVLEVSALWIFQEKLQMQSFLAYK